MEHLFGLWKSRTDLLEFFPKIIFDVLAKFVMTAKVRFCEKTSFSSAFLSEIQIYAIIPLTTIQWRNFNNFDILLGESEPFTTFVSCKFANLHPFLGMFWNFYSWNFSKHLEITASRYYITLHSNFSFYLIQ